MKYKTEWDLSHIYSGNVKKEVAKDCKSTEKKYLAFANKYRKNKKHLTSAAALAKTIEEYEKLTADKIDSRPSAYYSFRKSLNNVDNEAQAELNKLSDFYTELSNKLEFFILEIGKIPRHTQKKFLRAKELQPFRYFLKKIFETAKYDLSEAEEKIMNLKGLPSHGMWVSGFKRIIGKQVVKFENKDIPIAEAMGKLAYLPKEKRRKLQKDMMIVFKSISDFAESEINAIVTNKKIGDKLRGFKNPYDATVLGYENESKTVIDLVDAVNKNVNIAHRFYKIKVKMLGEKSLTYADRSAQVGTVNKKIPINEAIDKTIKAFGEADEEFANFVEYMFKGGFVDVFPKKNKTSGAFCSSPTGLPTYVLLNHTDDFRSLTTVAHELGHALHSKYSKKQRPLYEDYTIATAEVASTFFENLVFEQELKNATDKEKIVLLHDKISEDISTIFRQIACFNFELELHQRIRSEGFLPKEEIAKMMNAHMQNYLGPMFKMEENDGYQFTYWSHIRNFFYVYTYAFGQLISSALYQRYKEDRRNIIDVIKFISAGGSDSPENIFRSIGINPNKAFFEQGLKKIEEDIVKLEKLANKN